MSTGPASPISHHADKLDDRVVTWPRLAEQDLAMLPSKMDRRRGAGRELFELTQSADGVRFERNSPGRNASLGITGYRVAEEVVV